jgi:hypothetical protein
VGLDERPRGSTWPTSKVHYNSLPRTSIEGALGDANPTAPINPMPSATTTIVNKSATVVLLNTTGAFLLSEEGRD